MLAGTVLNVTHCSSIFDQGETINAHLFHVASHEVTVLSLSV